METNMALLADLNQDDFCNEDTKRKQQHAALREWFAPPPSFTSSNTSTAMTTAQRPDARNSHTPSSMTTPAPALVPALATDPDDDEDDAEITALYRRLNALKSPQPSIQHTPPPTTRVSAPPTPEPRPQPTVPAVSNSASSTAATSMPSMPSHGLIRPFTPAPPRGSQVVDDLSGVSASTVLTAEASAAEAKAAEAKAVEALETSRCISHANARLERIIASVLAEEAAYSHAAQQRELLARRLVVTNLAADADSEALVGGFGGWGGYIQDVSFLPHRHPVRRTRTAYVDMVDAAAAYHAEREVYGAVYGLIFQIRRAGEGDLGGGDV